ncbi:MAG: hypothetical protein JOS17DRAFT_760305 [Linnemannia elongata]|nr:MAG: hypothetical protein JOS17DRAFT_760305 [Linnemannia elongata]
MINTPSNVVACQPMQSTWETTTESTPPYTLSIHNGNNPTGPPLHEWSNINDSSYVCNAVLASWGSWLSLSLRDSTGKTVQSAPFAVHPGIGRSCK